MMLTLCPLRSQQKKMTPAAKTARPLALDPPAVVGHPAVRVEAAAEVDSRLEPVLVRPQVNSCDEVVY
jgi:hypothetical protein